MLSGNQIKKRIEEISSYLHGQVGLLTVNQVREAIQRLIKEVRSNSQQLMEDNELLTAQVSNLRDKNSKLNYENEELKVQVHSLNQRLDRTTKTTVDVQAEMLELQKRLEEADKPTVDLTNFDPTKVMSVSIDDMREDVHRKVREDLVTIGLRSGHSKVAKWAAGLKPEDMEIVLTAGFNLRFLLELCVSPGSKWLDLHDKMRVPSRRSEDAGKVGYWVSKKAGSYMINKYPYVRPDKMVPHFAKEIVGGELRIDSDLTIRLTNESEEDDPDGGQEEETSDG